MGAKSRRKGSRFEREIVNLLQDHGRAAERVPLSGMHGGKYRGDVSCPVLGDDWILEAKCRATGFRDIYRWLEDNDALVIKSDRRQPLVVLPLRRALEILHAIEAASVSRNLHEAAA